MTHLKACARDTLEGLMHSRSCICDTLPLRLLLSWCLLVYLRVHARTHTLRVYSPFPTPPHWLPQLCGKTCPVTGDVSWLVAVSISLVAVSISPSRRSLSAITTYLSHTSFLSYILPGSHKHIYMCVCVYPSTMVLVSVGIRRD